MIRQLKSRFKILLNQFQIEELTMEQLWKEVVDYYSQRHRAYHNLNHLQDIFSKLDNYRSEIVDIAAIEFAIWYHDIIYDSLSKKNEERSAELAAQRLGEIGLDKVFMDNVFALIISTKTHEVKQWELAAVRSANAYLLDLDLSILGSAAERYDLYVKQIRKEYKMIPSLLYKSGRKKVLRHFLEKERIFQTDVFFEQYEAKARANISRELGA